MPQVLISAPCAAQKRGLVPSWRCVPLWDGRGGGQADESSKSKTLLEDSPLISAAIMSLRELATASDVCTPADDGAGPANAVSSFANTLLGRSSKAQETLREASLLTRMASSHLFTSICCLHLSLPAHFAPNHGPRHLLIFCTTAAWRPWPPIASSLGSNWTSIH